MPIIRFASPLAGKRRTILLVLCSVACSLLPAAEIPTPIDPSKSGIDPADLDAPTFDVAGDPAVQGLLEVWNRADRFGDACMDCHGTPNAVEFALVGIDTLDIERRGHFHHEPEEIDKIEAGLDRLREIYGIGDRDRSKVFLAQPGPIDPESGTGQPLAGEHYYDRDYTFLTEELPRLTPTYAKRIDTMEQAEQAIEEFRAVGDSVRSFRAPFRSPLYSGDPAHPIQRGEKTGTLHKWVSLVPFRPISAAAATELTRLRAAYMAKPDNVNFYNLYQAEHALTGPFGHPVKYFDKDNEDRDPAFIPGFNAGAGVFEQAKRLSAMLAFHSMLQRSIGVETPILDKGFYAHAIPGEDTSGNDWKGFNPFHITGDRSGRPIPGAHLQTAKPTYPDDIDLSRRLNGAFTDFAAYYGSNKSAVVHHYRTGASNWWYMGLMLDPTQDITNPGGYWFQSLGGGVGRNGSSYDKIPREYGVEGYPSFFNWLETRNYILRYDIRLSKGSSGMGTMGDNHLGAINDRDVHVDDEHRQRLITVGLNSWKLQMARIITHVEELHERGENPHNAKSILVDHFTTHASLRMLADRELDDSEEQIAALDYFYDLLWQSINSSYAWPESYDPYPGTGDGLTAVYYDGPDFTKPLKTTVETSFDHREYQYYLPEDGWGDLSLFKIRNYGSPTSQIPNGDIQGYSAVFSGYIQAPFTDDYDITIREINDADLKARIIVDGTLVYQHGHHGSDGMFGAPHANGRRFGDDSVSRVRMERGKRYPIRIEMQNFANHNYAMRMLWQAPKYIAYQFVPSAYMYTTETSSRPHADDDSKPRIPHQTPHKAVTGQPFRYAVQVTGGDGDVNVSMGTGSLPAGLRFVDGIIMGTVTEELDGKQRPEYFTVGFAARDVQGDTDFNAITFTVVGEGDDTPPPPPAEMVRDITIRDISGLPWLPDVDVPDAYQDDDTTFFPRIPLNQPLMLTPTTGPGVANVSGDG